VGALGDVPAGGVVSANAGDGAVLGEDLIDTD
jgi:hypothetical protein